MTPTQAQIEAAADIIYKKYGNGLFTPYVCMEIAAAALTAAHEAWLSETFSERWRAAKEKAAAEAKAALAAAAEVGENGFCEECEATLPSHRRNCKTGSPVDAAIAATIERCAQALEPLMQEILGEGNDYAMGVNDTVRQGQTAIRALKDKP